MAQKQDKIDKAAAVLRDESSGWVHRRDAADLLGRIAARALQPLHERLDEPDLDVQASINRGLGQAQAVLHGIDAVVPEGHSLEELAKLCEKEGSRDVSPHEEGFVVNVKMRDERKQKVYLMPHTRKDDTKLIRVFTYCGAANADAEAWALRANNKLTHCAIALVNEDDGEKFVLTHSFIDGDVTPREMKSAVKEIAFYGDWVEGKLSDLDDF